jgi:plasmid stabilization system protein ParE
MMRYTVVWLQDALDDLTWLWLAADDRAAVTAATARVDSILSSSATSVGEPVTEGLLRLVAPPLTIFFCVRHDDRIVEVVRVRRTRAAEWTSE